jgi:hypothetical protein
MLKKVNMGMKNMAKIPKNCKAHTVKPSHSKEVLIYEQFQIIA